MWKAPYRPKGEVSQSFPDGVLTIYAQEEGAQPGLQPKPVLRKKGTLRYEERALGIRRYYAAAQNQMQIDRVVRVPYTGTVNSQDVAGETKGETTRLYRIDLIQKVPDVYPPCADLTLVRYEQGVEVSG